MGELFRRLSEDERRRREEQAAKDAANAPVQQQTDQAAARQRSADTERRWDEIIDALDIPNDLTDLGQYLQLDIQEITREKGFKQTKYRIGSNTSEIAIRNTHQDVENKFWVNGYALGDSYTETLKKFGGKFFLFAGIYQAIESTPQFIVEAQDGLSLGRGFYYSHNKTFFDLFAGSMGRRSSIPQIDNPFSMQQTKAFIQDRLFQIGRQYRKR